MNNPKLTVSLFKIRTMRAVVKMTYTADVYAEPGNIAMADAIADLIQNMSDHGTPQFMTFTRYSRNHAKDQIEQCSAIMLEYPYRLREQLNDRLANLPYAYFQIDTQADFDVNAEARVLIAFPLEEPITEPRQYTRVASLLWDEIGIDAHTHGDISSTFLFAPYTVRPNVKFYGEDRIFIDPAAFLAQHHGTWVDARSQAEPTIEPSANDDTGLFYYPEVAIL